MLGALLLASLAPPAPATPGAPFAPESTVGAESTVTADAPAGLPVRPGPPAPPAPPERLMVAIDGQVDWVDEVGGQQIAPGWVVVEAPEGADAIAELVARPGVETIRPELDYVAAALPDEPCLRRGDRRCLDDTGSSSWQWYLDALGADEAWEVTRGDPEVVVAVLDSGVRRTHAELAGRVEDWSSCGMADPNGASAHATRVAGLIGAAVDGVGVAGLGWSTTVADVAVLQVTDGLLLAREADVVAALRCVADRGVEVVNMSFAGGRSDALQEAVEHARRRDVVMVAAAGNDRATDSLRYPAAYDGVLAVGAVDATGAVTPFSNTGDWVDLFAPGHDLLTLGADSDRDYDSGVSGTSFSSPLVAATAALVRAEHPEWTAAEVLARLRRAGRATPGSRHGTLAADVAATAEPVRLLTVTDTGRVGAYGDAISWGDAPPGAVVVGASATPSGRGYWMVEADGTVHARGDAPDLGGLDGLTLAAPVVGMAGSAGGEGYWLVAADGGVFAFGGAAFAGSMGGSSLVAPVVGMAGSAGGEGYWLVAADGGVFAFGGAAFAGSMGGSSLVAPVVGMAGSAGGEGYWLVAADGGVFAFGGAAFAGSMGGSPSVAPVVGMNRSPGGGGYWMLTSDGALFDFGDAPRVDAGGPTTSISGPGLASSATGAPEPSTWTDARLDGSSGRLAATVELPGGRHVAVTGN